MALQRLLALAERVLMVMLLSLTSGAYLPLLGNTLGSEGNGPEASPLTHVFLLPLYAALSCVIVTHPRGFSRVAWRAGPALALVGLACMSTLWSIEPSLSLRRGISLLAPTAVGIVLTLRFEKRESLRLLAIALGLAAIISIIVVLLLPAEGIMYFGAWTGVYDNKNSFGRAMALEVAVLALIALDAKRYRVLAWLAAAGTMALVLLSASVGALMAAAAVLVLIPLFRSLRLRLTKMVAVCTIGVLVGAIVLTVILSNTEEAFALLGRDPTLTGRTEIWAAAFVSIAERPWLGYGHNAFWQGWVGPSISLVSSIGWETPNSHNGLVDLWLELGLVGVLTFLLGLGIAARRAILQGRHTATAAGLWPLVFLTYLVVMNISTSTIMLQHSLYWVLYVAVMSSSLVTETRKPRSLEGRSEAGPGSLREDRSSSRLPPQGRHVSPGIRRQYPGVHQQ
jgi:O-antigen ligase